jgi:SAM-dependent methyltransferase
VAGKHEGRGQGRGLNRSVAESVDAPVELVPVFGQLFAGMPSLGSSPRVVMGLLRGAGVKKTSRVLDLACGKGTAAVLCARAIGYRVEGVDGCAAFVEEARALALRWGVERRATFEVADLSRWRCTKKYDAAMMLGLWPLEVAAASLRGCVKRGGVYVVDDVYFDAKHGRVPRGLEAPPTLEEARALVEGLGDRVERVWRVPVSAARRMNARLYARLRENAARVGKERPELRAALGEFLRRQREANRVLGGAFRAGVWVVRRGS